LCDDALCSSVMVACRSFIASHLTGRLGKQCRERWFNHLNPDIKKEAWTPEEDRIILGAHHELGNKWSDSH
jgi:myb proto-oncogene protein